MEAATVPPQQEPLTEDAILAALTLIALTPDLPEPDMLSMVEALLAPVGIAADAARAAGLLAFGAAMLPRVEGAGQAYGFTARTAPARRAAYLLNAAKRIDAAHARVVPQERAARSLEETGSPEGAAKLRERAARDARFEERERDYLAQHLAAERARADAAVRADIAARSFGPVLGWRARMDDRTTPGCRQLHRTNFHVLRPPDGFLPGARHGGSCRCEAVVAWPEPRAQPASPVPV